jgi:hypothetical protein
MGANATTSATSPYGCGDRSVLALCPGFRSLVVRPGPMTFASADVALQDSNPMWAPTQHRIGAQHDSSPSQSTGRGEPSQQCDVGAPNHNTGCCYPNFCVRNFTTASSRCRNHVMRLRDGGKGCTWGYISPCSAARWERKKRFCVRR